MGINLTKWGFNSKSQKGIKMPLYDRNKTSQPTHSKTQITFAPSEKQITSLNTSCLSVSNKHYLGIYCLLKIFYDIVGI